MVFVARLFSPGFGFAQCFVARLFLAAITRPGLCCVHSKVMARSISLEGRGGGWDVGVGVEIKQVIHKRLGPPRFFIIHKRK